MAISSLQQRATGSLMFSQCWELTASDSAELRRILLVVNKNPSGQEAPLLGGDGSIGGVCKQEGRCSGLGREINGIFVCVPQGMTIALVLEFLIIFLSLTHINFIFCPFYGTSRERALAGHW